MGKKTNKTAKLGKRDLLALILTELETLKAGVKALTRQQQALLVERTKGAAATKARAGSAGKAAKATSAAKAGARKAGPAPKRPVLVAPAEVPPTAAE